MQMILEDSEIEIIYESLITEKKEWEEDLKIAKQKGRNGEFEKNAIKPIDDLIERFTPYVKEITHKRTETAQNGLKQ